MTDLDQEAKGDNDTDDVPEKLQIYRKLVQAVILLMKRKFEAAMGILKEIDQGHKVKKESNDGIRKFQYMVCTYRAYGFITMKKYD